VPLAAHADSLIANCCRKQILGLQSVALRLFRHTAALCMVGLCRVWSRGVLRKTEEQRTELT
jgi:hypothetical protein